MAVFLSPVGGAGAQFSDNNGHPLNGGKLYTYQAGTTTPAATYTSAAGVSFHPNPIILNAGGRVPDSGEIWLADNISYKFVLKTSADVLIATWDNISGINSNFVNYTVQEEVITATAGQTVFNLSTITYAPATNSLAVYIDGVNQIVDDSYLETDSNTVTFVSGLHDGALVKFTTAVPATGTATNADVVTYDPPFTGAVPTTVEAKLAQTVSVKDFGAVGDGVTDDTAAIQAALDSGVFQVYFPEGTYLFKNLTIPNVRMTMFGDGYWRTTLKCASPTNTAYGIASAAYVNNATSGNEPVTIRNLNISGDNLVDFPLVIYGYYSEINQCQISNARAGGYAIRFTSNGISGSACSTTLVENKLIDCRIAGGDGNAFIVGDTGARCTDMIIRGNVFTDGAVVDTSMAGHIVTDNHFYGGTVAFNKMGQGTIVSNNYFETAVTLDDMRDEVVGLSGNRFLARVSVNFGASGKTCVFDGCLWQGSADLFHNFFASDKRAVVNGGGFETGTPVVFSNGASTGWVSFNRVWNHATTTFWTGSRQASVSSIRQELPFAPVVSADQGDNSATLTWTSSATTNRWASALSTDKTVTLSTTNAINGARFRVVRTGGGAFNLNVGTGPLKALAANQWCEVEYDGSAWMLTAFGSL